jgi:hypothetical protein
MTTPKLYTKLPQYLRCGNFFVKINPAFHVVLQCQQIINDTILTEQEKVDLCVSRIICPGFFMHVFSGKQRKLIFKEYFENFVQMGPTKNDHSARAFDFTQDATYIYAAFWQCYGIDLLGTHKNLHWWKFMMLLGGLSSDTRFMEIVGIRTAKLPKPTKYNAEMRADLMRKKALFGLKLSEEERTANVQQGFVKLAVMLESWAQR